MRRMTCLALAAAVLVAGGCGESDSEKFTDKAEGICGAVTKQVNEIQGSSASPLQRVQQLEPILTKLKADLSSLNPPAARKVAFDRYVAQIDQLASVLGQIETAARTNDRQAAAALLPKIQQVQRSGVQAAKDAGLPKCGQ